MDTIELRRAPRPGLPQAGPHAGGISCIDWRLDDEAADRLVAEEAAAWLRDLNWDVSDAWSAIAPARRAGALPGMLARAANDAVVGWTAFVPQGEHLQVMAIAAADDTATRALVAAVVATDEARRARSVIVCAREGRDSLARVLRDAGFDVDRYRYLSLDLEAARPVAHECVRWQSHDEAAMARLCARAYGTARGLRAFAPDDTPAEWRDYIRNLIGTRACGVFAPDLSWVVPGDDGELTGAVMVSELGPATAHIGQVAVDPRHRGRGVARRLLSAALSSAAPFFSRVTLLVSESNQPALSLYASLGFTHTAGFVVASKRR